MSRAAEAEGATYVASRLVDRLALNGELITIDGRYSLDEQFPLKGYVTEKLLHGCVDKVALARGSVPVAPGHHFAAGKSRLIFLPVHTTLNGREKDLCR